VCAAACLCVCSPAADKALVVAEHDDAERGRGGVLVRCRVWGTGEGGEVPAVVCICDHVRWFYKLLKTNCRVWGTGEGGEVRAVVCICDHVRWFYELLNTNCRVWGTGEGAEVSAVVRMLLLCCRMCNCVAYTLRDLLVLRKVQLCCLRIA